MTDDRTREQIANMAAAVLAELSILQQNNPLRDLHTQLDVLARRGKQHNVIDARLLENAAAVLKRIDDGGIAAVVRDIRAQAGGVGR